MRVASTRFLLTALATTLAVAVAQEAAPTPLQAVAPARAQDHGVGTLIPDLAVTTVDGEVTTFSACAGDHGLVIAFTTSSCPLSRRQAPELTRIIDSYGQRGFGFLIVNPAEDEDDEAIRAMMANRALHAPATRDPMLRLGRALGARVTTDVFVLDSGRTLVYRGAIDDQYGIGVTLPAPRRRLLIDALDAVARGERPAVRATLAVGCALPDDLLDQDAVAEEGPPPEITFHGRISRIVQESCQPCHREGECAPFPLMDYSQVRARRGPIKVALRSGAMPPWPHADGGPFTNDRSLPERDREDFLAWLAAGAPEGDTAEAPLPRKFAAGWRIGEPQHVLQIPRVFEVPAEGVLDYRWSQVKTRFGEDRWVQAMEIRPTAPENVHHVLVFVEFPRDHPRAGEQLQHEGGLRGYFAGMVPGQGDVTFPAGTAKLLPRGATLHFQVHYVTTGKPARDRTRLGLIFANGRPAREIVTRGIATTDFVIPPGASSHRVVMRRLLREPGQILGMSPHMHLRGKAFRFELSSPGGRRRTILDVPRYDFDWQVFYELANPVTVEAGSRLVVTAVYDNSADNLRNPDPAATVRFGEQTFDEMMIGYYHFVPLVPDEEDEWF